MTEIKWTHETYNRWLEEYNFHTGFSSFNLGFCHYAHSFKESTYLERMNKALKYFTESRDASQKWIDKIESELESIKTQSLELGDQKENKNVHN